MPKTATTYLQQNVFPHIQGYSSRLIYDKGTFDKLFKHIEECFVHEQKPLAPHRENLREHLSRLQERHPDGLLLVSREQIASLHHVRYERYHQVIREVFGELNTRVIIVARYQPDWLWSLYKHTVSQAYTFTPEQFFRMEGEGEALRFSYRSGADPLERDFWALYQSYREAFERVELKFFEEFAEDDRTFVDDIFSEYGLGYEYGWPEERRNVNIPDRALGLFLKGGIPPFGLEMEEHRGELGPRVRNRLRREADGMRHAWNRTWLRAAKRYAPRSAADRYALPRVLHSEELRGRFNRRNREMSAITDITPPERYIEEIHNHRHATSDSNRGNGT